jgi:xylulokinase
LIRAILEGVSYSQKDCLDIIEQLGVPVKSVRASGGGAKSVFWRQLLSNVMNKRVVTLATQEGSAYGSEAAVYQHGHSIYNALYPALKRAYVEIAAL